MSTSFAPTPMTVVFGLGTRLLGRMRTELENGVLCNGSFIDKGDAMKTLSAAPRCDKHHLRAKSTVSI